MKSLSTKTYEKKVFEAVIAVTGWFAIAVQAYLTTGNMSNLFSYFTILTNLLVALSCTLNLFFSATKLSVFFNTASVKSAIALYIFIVSLVYNTVLRGIVTINGWDLFVDTLLHVVIPIIYVLYWFLFVPKKVLQWKDGISWIYFPIAYLIYSLIRGAMLQWYPYPFLNVNELGYAKVFINIEIMITVFFIAGLGVILINRSMNNKV